MAEHTIVLTDQDIQRMEAILIDESKDEALEFLREVVKERLRSSAGHACGPKSV